MEKHDIINGLAREFGWRRYLEICTPTTGNKFHFIDTSQFEVIDRLMYRCPEGFADGAAITFRDAGDHSHALLSGLNRSLPADARYDVILVDPYHTYQDSLLDLYGALCVLRPGGVLVVHDCNPVDPDTVSPQFQHGDWCGVTYQAFIDFVCGTHCAGYCTVDTDEGCGVVFTPDGPVPPAWRAARPPDRLLLDWIECRDDDIRRFEFFERHRRALLNLVSAEQFLLVHPLTGAWTDVAGLALPEDGIDPHVLADGRRINPFRISSSGWRFLIPPGVRSLRLRSRTLQPNLIGDSPDSRPLGLCLTSLMVRIGNDESPVPLDHPWLNQGLYGTERSEGRMWRWANGDTPLPMALLGEGRTPVMMTIRGHYLSHPSTNSD